MSEQRALRRRIATLESQQAQRVEMVAECRAAMDATLERKQRELDNLRAQLTIGVVA